MSIRLRLTAWYSAVLAVTLFIFGIAIYWIAEQSIYGEVKKRLNKQVELMNFSGNVNYWDGGLDLNVGGGFENDEIYLQIVNLTNGAVKKSTNLGNMTFPYPKSVNEIKEGFKFEKVGKFPFLIFEMPLYLKVKNQIVGVAQVAAYTGREAIIFERLGNILIFTSISTLIISSSIGLFLARKSLRPIENVIRAANRIQKGTDLSVRIKREGPNDEIGQLTDTVNSMLSRMEVFYKELDESYRAQRRFVSDASHELRTPLTTIRGNVDLLDKMWRHGQTDVNSHWDEETKREMSMEALQDIAGEAQRMSRLVNDLLALARADAGVTMEKEMQPLKPLVEEVIRRAQFLPRTATWVHGDLSELDEALVNGNKEYLQQMLFIFIENAFKYTREGSVTISAVRHENQIGIRIQDTGIGMDKNEVPHIFDRFYRADESRGIIAGTGLGLSIAKWIIDEHQGSVEVVTSINQGSTFIIWLPAVFHLPVE